MSNAYTRTGLTPDARTGYLKSVNVTLHATPGNVTDVYVPDGARGFRLYPATAVRFAVGEDPAAAAAQTDETVTTAELAVGGIAVADAWEVRLLEPGVDRQLRLRGAAGSEVVDVEFF